MGVDSQYSSIVPVDADGRPLNREYLIEVVSNRQGDVDARTVDTLWRGCVASWSAAAISR